MASVGDRLALGVSVSRMSVEVLEDHGNSLVRVASTSKFAPMFDSGTNWAYIEQFENALRQAEMADLE
jgi:hypothetical protein